MAGNSTRIGACQRHAPVRWGWALTAVFAALAPGLAHAAYTIDIVAPRSVKKLLKDHLDLSRFAKRDDLTDEQFAFLVTATPRQVTDLIQTEGFFAPVVKTDVRTRDGKKQVRVDVDPGPRTVIKSVDLRFHGAVEKEDPAREQAARDAWTLDSGDPFTQQAWTDAKNNALKALQAKRYLAAKIDTSQARIDPRKRAASLAASFDSGPTFTLGPIEIIGMRRYPEDIIRHVNPLHVGEVYSAERVQELQRQVQSTPYFASVAVDVANDPAHPENTPVRVKVSEFPYNSIRSGVGYSTDTGAQVQTHYSYNNVFGRAWVFDAQARIEQKQQYGSLQLSMPPDDKSYVYSALGSYTRTNVEGTDIHSLRAGLQRARSRQFYDYNLSLLFYEDRLDQNVGPATVSRALVPSFAWTRRNVDDPIFPRRGNLFGVEAGFAIKGLLTDQTFVRAYAHGRQYVPLGKNDLLVLRAELGGVFTGGGSSGIPASLLFRAGGADSVRGYSYHSIGNLVSGSVLPTKYLLTGGAEYQHWFSHSWGGALFYDIGTATDAWAEKVFFQGVGFGARWRSPVGPVNLDLAYGLRDRRIEPYLTLGIAF